MDHCRPSGTGYNIVKQADPDPTQNPDDKGPKVFDTIHYCDIFETFVRVTNTKNILLLKI